MKGSTEAGPAQGECPVLHWATLGTCCPLLQGTGPVSPGKSCQSRLSGGLGFHCEHREQAACTTVRVLGKDGFEHLSLCPRGSRKKNSPSAQSLTPASRQRDPQSLHPSVSLVLSPTQRDLRRPGRSRAAKNKLCVGGEGVVETPGGGGRLKSPLSWPWLPLGGGTP